MRDTPQLDFAGPCGMCGEHQRLLFVEPISRTSGICLWTVRTSNGFIAAYVGQTGESFAKRTKDHMI